MDVHISKSFFEIKDNCGGIPWNYALKEAFLFGHKSKGLTNQLGVYGIGLKRAIFKLGNDIYLRSQTARDGFETHIDVDKWAEDEHSWELPLNQLSAAPSLEESGTAIRVTKLRPEVEMRLKTGSIETKLKNSIGEAYTLFLERYVRVRLNGETVTPIPIPLGESDEVQLANDSFERSMDEGKVNITLIASLASRDSGGKWRAEAAGWYALCNGRVVVAADKTDLTGWGVAGPAFHSKYAGFIGIAFFYSTDPYLLPWTTTKRGLNRESAVYQEARNRMIGTARPVLNFLNKMYPSDPLPGLPERKIAEQIQIVDIRKAASEPSRTFAVTPGPATVQKTTVRVQFDALISDLDRVRKRLKKRSLSAGAIGEHALKYFLEKECLE